MTSSTFHGHKGGDTIRKRQEEWLCLTNVYDSYEANMIKALLEPGGIPVLEKRPGSGAYMEVVAGISNIGIELYVPAQCYQEALALLASLPEAELDADNKGDAVTDRPPDENKTPGLVTGQSGPKLLYILLIIALIYGVYKVAPLISGW